MSAKDRKARRDAMSDPYDDIDIFSGPGGQVLVDIDPLYGGIQQQKDEKPGDQAMRDLTRLAQKATTALTPGAATQEEMQNIEKQRQEALQFLLKATGADPESFQGKNLEAKLRRDKELQKALGIKPDLLKDLKFDFARAGEFLFGDANKGLTTMTETGATFQSLPFEQKLGIAILPIDALDLVGVSALGARGLGILVRGGIKQFGKKSGKTVQDLLNDEEFISKLETENPGFMRELDNTLGGGIIQKRFMTGQNKGPVGGKPEEVIDSPTTTAKQNVKEQTTEKIRAEEIRRTAEGLEGTFAGKQAQDPAPPKGSYPLTTLKKSIKNDSNFENEETINNFISFYENQYQKSSAGPARERYMEEQLGKDNFEKLKELAKQQGLKIRNMGPQGKKLTEDGMTFLQENYKTSNAQELLDVLNSDKARYFHTNKDGELYGFNDLNNFINYKNDQGFVGTPRMPEEVTRLGTAKYNKAVEQFEKKIKEIQKAGKVELTPEVIAKEFEFAVRRAEGIGNQRLTAKDAQLFSNLYQTRIKRFNESLPEGSPLRVLNRREISKLKAGNVEGRSQIGNKFLLEVTKNEDYQEALKFLGDGNSETLKRYLNFIRESTPDVKGDVREFGNFLDSMSPRLKDLQNEHSIFRKNYYYFKIVDNARDELGELTKPFLNKLFKTPAFAEIDGKKIVFDKDLIDPDARTTRSLQIAHRYEGSQIGETLPKDLEGASEFPQSYTIDVSFINQGVQPQLEAKARNAIASGNEDALREIHLDAERFGTAFEVDGIQFGTQKGIADKLEQYLQYVVLRPELQKKFGITKEEILNMRQAIDKARSLNTAGYNFQRGGSVDDMNIFDDEEKGQILPRISIEFGDAALGRTRQFGEGKPEDMVPLPLEEIQLGDAQPVKRASAVPQEKVFDVPPMENIFTGEVEQANLKLPFYKLFTKPPVNETAPIPTPKEKLDNPTKKQKESLEQEKLNKEQDFFDPTPEDNAKVDLGSSTDVAVTPKTNQALTGVFYSDVERALQRPDTPVIFPNKKALLDFLAKNRIKKTELDDYGINNLLQGFDDVTPIPKLRVIQQIRSAPVRGMHVHATGYKSELIDTSDRGAIPVAFDGYREDGFLPGTQSERVLFIPKDKLPGDTGGAPQTIFQGESIANHNFGIANESDAYIVGWTRLTERQAILPTKLAAPQAASKVPGLTRERDRVQRQLSGLYAEAINKLNREGVRRGLNQADLDIINDLSLERMLVDYGDSLNEISPGLVDQMDELIVKARDLDSEIAKGSTVDTSGVVRVQFADEIQSDIMQAAAGRKQKLLATLRKIQEEGRESTTLPELDRIGNEALAFFEENKSVFRPLGKTDAEIETFRDSLSKIDAEIDDIINRFVETREISDVEIARVKSLLTDNIDSMINDLIVVSDKTYEGLFPDLPFKKREEWADALIKKDLFELAYRKFVLKDPNTPDYYAVTPDQFVIDRYNFKGNTATAPDLRERDKKRQIDRFMARGEFVGSEFKGIGMSEFYGGPNAKTFDGKHYTSVIEKILKTQAKANNSEFTVLNVQTKNGSQDVYRITDQNGNMVATLSNRGQAERLLDTNPNYVIQTIRVPDEKSTTPSFAIKITEEMLEPYKTHKARGGLVEMIDIFEVD